MSLTELERRWRQLVSPAHAHPWQQRAQAALDHVRPTTDLSALVNRTGLLNLNEVRPLLNRRDKAREREIGHLLRHHRVQSVKDPQEIELRSSFDGALTSLQLIELAIETSYVRLTARPRLQVRTCLFELLWTKGARSFIDSYEYVAVRFLAERVGVSWASRRIAPPEPEPEAEVRFATFFSRYLLWESDAELGDWLQLLDGYQQIDKEKKVFRAFLDTGTVPDGYKNRALSLATGLLRFILFLADMFETLAPPEVPRFGTMFSFWMAKFYGYELVEGKYRSTNKDWSASSRWLPGRLVETAGGAELLSAQLDLALASLSGGWTSTRALVEAAMSDS